MKLWIGLPAYNEEIAIERLLAKFYQRYPSRSFSYEIVLYSDGSTDRTVEVANGWTDRLNLTIINEPVNKGLGEGLRRLIAHTLAEASDEDVFALMDCDDTHDPAQLDDLVKRIGDGYSVVIASRYRRNAVTCGVPLHRLLLSYGAALLFKAIHPIRGVFDYTCGYRAYKVPVLKSGVSRYGNKLISNQGFACMVELLLKLHQPGVSFKEIPLKLRYDLKPTESKMDVGSNTFHTLFLLARWRILGIN